MHVLILFQHNSLGTQKRTVSVPEGFMVLQVAAYLMSHNLFYRRAHGPLFDMVAWEAEDMQDLRGFADGRQVGLIRKDVHLGHVKRDVA